MIDQADKHHAPRRYFVDPHGHRVLIGLSFEETMEFEELDGALVLGEGHDTTAAAGGAMRRMRWLQIYEKHDTAWKAWIAQSRAEQALDSAFLNHG
jgi:hypothetical protein